MSVVLYNSPLAVALLVLAIVFVVAGTAAQHTRLYRLAGLLPDDHIAPFRHHVLASACAVLVILLFWLALGWLSFHQAFSSPTSFRLPPEELRWSPATEPAPRIVLDRFDLPSSASSEERLRVP